MKLRGKLFYVSTGTNAIDSFVGPMGVPLGSFIALDEPKSHQHFGLPILRCFLAEGLEGGDCNFVAFPSKKNLQLLLQNIPMKASSASITTGALSSSNGLPENEQMKIAWRYNTMPIIDSSLQNQKNLNKFDLSRKNDKIDVDRLIEEGTLTIFNSNKSSLVQPSLMDLWDQLSELILKEKFALSGGNGKKVLRIILGDLTSPIWSDLHMLSIFTGLLKSFCRYSNALVLFSIDTSLLSQQVKSSILRTSDAFFMLEHIPDDEQRKAMGMGRADGRFYIMKLPTIGSVTPENLPESIDLIFTLKRQCLTVEIFHLPPAIPEEEGGRTSSVTKMKIGMSRLPCQALADEF